MRTSELIEKINTGVDNVIAEHVDGQIHFFEVGQGKSFYRFPEWGTSRGSGNASFCNLNSTYMVELFKLMELLDEYARTPLRDREKLKEYHLILTAPLADTDLSYLNLNKTTKKYWFSDKKETSNQQTIFTEAEIEKMNIEGLKKVEVL